MKLLKYSLIALISISLFSCEKDDDTTEPTTPTTPTTPTNTEKLCGKNFITSDYTLIQNGVTITTGLDTNFYPACQQDNIQRFETDSSLAFDEGATKCDPTDPQTEAGNWVFYDSETKLIFEPGPDADTLNIITNNGTVLTLGGSFIIMGDTIEFRQTYTAQ